MVGTLSLWLRHCQYGCDVVTVDGTLSLTEVETLPIWL